ncbi:sodium-coupled neutral amino acid transporter 9 homolog isoform X2 [Rhodnius prolixus]|uniref:sodium-coupled neutral amino acid transporter 9 homolog isoform X2 n=1 Tax=Rhodnius prolixus TaxID=13249 RepID=UPI003D1879F3
MTVCSETKPLLLKNVSRRASLWRAFSQDSINPISCSSKLMESPASGKPEVEWKEAVTRQSSIVTIFAIWNTMMGTSLLAMPWGIQRAGLVVGPALTAIMGALCLYTAYCNLRAHSQFGTATDEISELTRSLLGATSELVSKTFSLIVLLGANIVYWILMSNFLYHSVHYFYSVIKHLPYDTNENITSASGVYCPTNVLVSSNSSGDGDSLFTQIWSLDCTVPVFLALIIIPLLNFKSPTFFTKFNSLGTMSVMYLIIFVFVKSASWGVNIDIKNTSSINYSPLAMPSFPATSGMLALSFFIHNIIITIMKSNADQKNNGRDLSIAYALVTATYLLIGAVFYISFPLAKNCIQDNLLNNFVGWDTMTVIGRVFLLFQLVTVYPLISYMLRVQTMITLAGIPYPSRLHVIAFNAIMVIICVLFAIFLPKIGTIIRYTGALSGLVHVFALPCLLRLASLYKNDKIKLSSWILYTIIPLFGAINLLGQFFVSDN